MQADAIRGKIEFCKPDPNAPAAFAQLSSELLCPRSGIAVE